MTKITKKYIKPEKKYKWARWNNKLEIYDITIDLADIKHLSRKMYETGKISRKVLKKWRNRDYSRKKDSWCGKKGGSRCKCFWLPAGVFRRWTDNKAWDYTSTHWHCLYCRSETGKVYDDEISQALANAYEPHTLSHRWE